MVLIWGQSCDRNRIVVRYVSTTAGHDISGHIVECPIHVRFGDPIRIRDRIGNASIVRSRTGWAVVRRDFHRIGDDVIDIYTTLSNTSCSIPHIEGVGASGNQVGERMCRIQRQRSCPRVSHRCSRIEIGRIIGIGIFIRSRSVLSPNGHLQFCTVYNDRENGDVQIIQWIGNNERRQIRLA